MLPSDQFLVGLISFLVGHIFYIMAFTSAKRIRINWAVLPFILYGALIFAILLPSFGKLRLPVLIYIIVILTMGWQAWDRWTKRRQVFAFLALIGAVLFIFSDTILAFNMFFEPFGPARALTFGLYFPAQWFLAQSIQQSRAPE